MTNRLREVIGRDSGGEVARKLARQGVSVSYQAVHKWINGGRITDENLAALAAAYGVSVAWLKYGEQDARPPLVEVLDGLSLEDRQQVLDFIEYRINRPGAALDPKSIGRYMAMIDRIRRDMDHKKISSR